MPLRKNKIDPFKTDWDRRGLFRKKRGWAGKVWWLMLGLVIASVVTVGHELPELLLNGFKAIAHLAPPPDDLLP